MREILIFLLALVLAGCAVGPARNAPDYDGLMQTARARYAAGEHGKARALYVKAADANPTRSAPWLGLSRIDFDHGSYGDAINNAREALHRNPDSDTAQTLLMVSGLRVALDALNVLRSELDTDGATRDTAVLLISKMRDVLGEDVLFSDNAGKTPHQHAPKLRQMQAAARKRAPVADQKNTKRKKSRVPPKPFDSPFQALPGSSN